MYEFDTPEYWEQEQLDQYEREMYEQQCREQEEQAYYEYCNACLGIAHDWLLGKIDEQEAYTHMSYIPGASPTELSLLEWAEEVLKGVK